MAFGRRRNVNPIDRAVEDLEHQLAALQQQISAADRGGTIAPATVSRTESMGKFIKEILSPPPKKATSPSHKARRDLFDASAQPMQDLTAEPIAFAKKPETDLFTGAATPKRIDCAPKPEEKLAIYIGAGSLKGFKKPLRVEQRRNRNRFFMWIGLSFVALWFIWAVVR